MSERPSPREPKAALRHLVRVALDASHAGDAVRRSLSLHDDVLVARGAGGEQLRIPLRGCDVWIVAIGKAAVAMGEAAHERLGEVVTRSFVLTKEGHGRDDPRWICREAGHPIPDERGVEATEELRALLEGARDDVVVITLLSGGASALLAAPVDGLRLEDLREVTRMLIASGADIQAINTVRRHLGRALGGRLMRATHPARVLVLAVSDVVGDDLHDIGSGPWHPDPTTLPDTRQVLERYGLWEEVPEAVRSALGGRSRRAAETPKEDDPIFRRAHHLLVATNRSALRALASEARALGFDPLVLTSTLRGEAREVGRVLAAIAREAWRHGEPIRPPACLLSGGEPTVTLTGTGGRGGRNQELALAFALEIDGTEGIHAASLATDGTDGPTHAAGAFVDGATAGRARSSGRDPREHLDRHDALPLFETLGDLIVTGPTGTNVMDIHLVLVLDPDSPCTSPS